MESDLSGKMLLVEEARQTVRLMNLNIELSEMLYSHLDYVFRFCEANGIAPPSAEKTRALMEKERMLVCQITGASPDAGHRGGITGEGDTIRPFRRIAINSEEGGSGHQLV